MSRFFCFFSNPFKETWEQACIRGWKIGHYLCLTPYHFNERTSLLQQNTHFINKLLRSLFIFLCFTDVTYFACICQNITLESYTPTEFVKFYVHFLSRAAAFFPIILNNSFTSILPFYNILIFSSRNNKIYSKSIALYEIFASSVVSFCCIQPIFPFIMYLHNPYSIRYWPSQFPWLYSSQLFSIFYAANDLLISYTCLFNSVVFLMPVINYNMFANQWICSLK